MQVVRPTDIQLEIAKLLGEQRNSESPKLGYRRPDGTRTSLAEDTLAALAELVVEESLDVDSQAGWNQTHRADIIIDDIAIHVRHTTLPNGRLMVRERDRGKLDPNYEHLFVLVRGDSDRMAIVGCWWLDWQQFKKCYLYAVDPDGEVRFVPNEWLEDW